MLVWLPATIALITLTFAVSAGPLFVNDAVRRTIDASRHTVRVVTDITASPAAGRGLPYRFVVPRLDQGRLALVSAKSGGGASLSVRPAT